MAEHRVTAGAVVAKLEDGRERYIYRGGSLAGVPAKEIKRLVDLGMVEQVGAKPGPKPKSDDDKAKSEAESKSDDAK